MEPHLPQNSVCEVDGQVSQKQTKKLKNKQKEEGSQTDRKEAEKKFPQEFLSNILHSPSFKFL